MYKYNMPRSTPIPPNLPPPHPISRSYDKPPIKKKKKLNLLSLKNDACSSLYDVEHFLCNFNSFVKYIKLYNLFK